MAEPSSVIRVACPPAPDGCGAAVGAKCVTKSGMTSRKFHQARYAVDPTIERYEPYTGEVPAEDPHLYIAPTGTPPPEIAQDKWRLEPKTGPIDKTTLDRQAEAYTFATTGRNMGKMARYEATELDVEEFMAGIDLDQRPTREEARAFLTMYANGDLDGLTSTEVVEKLKATNAKFIDSITDEWDRLTKSVTKQINFGAAPLLEHMSTERGPFRRATAQKKKGGKYNDRRAKNRIARKTKQKQRKKK